MWLKLSTETEEERFVHSLEFEQEQFSWNCSETRGCNSLWYMYPFDGIGSVWKYAIYFSACDVLEKKCNFFQQISAAVIIIAMSIYKLIINPSLCVNNPVPLISPKVGKTLTAEGNSWSSPLHRMSCHRQQLGRSRRTVNFQVTVPYCLIAVYSAYSANPRVPD